MNAEPTPHSDPEAAGEVAPPDTPIDAATPPASAPAPESLVVPGPGAEEAEEVGWLDRLRMHAARLLARRKVPALVLSAAALILAALGGASLAIDHYGLGAVLGLVAVAAAWLATAPTSPGDDADVRNELLARLLAHATVPLLLGGTVMEAAAAGAPGRAALGTWAMAALLLLPLTRGRVPSGTPARGPSLWSFAERMVAVLAGFLLGHPALPLFLVGCVATADLVIRLSVLRPRTSEQAGAPSALQDLFGLDGRPQPGVRLACRLGFAVVILVYVLLGRSDGWRF